MTLLVNDTSSTHESLRGTALALEVTLNSTGEVLSRFKLPEGKCTIGSSPSCQLRLPSDFVRPLHCLIVRKNSEVVATRWAAGITLNGLEFASAPLVVGDCLSLGDVKLELVGQEVVASHYPTTCPVELIEKVESSIATALASTGDLLNSSVADQPVLPLAKESPNAADVARLHSANKQARNRFRRLVSTLRELREKARTLDQHVNDLSEQLKISRESHGQLTYQLSQAQAVAIERESQFSEELDHAIAELSASYDRANAAEQKLQESDAKLGELRRQIEEFTSESAYLRENLSATTVKCDEWEKFVTDRDASLMALHDEIARLKQIHETSERELTELNSQLRSEITSMQAHHDAQLAELDTQVQLAQQTAQEAELKLREPNTEIERLTTQLLAIQDQHQLLVVENARLTQEASEAWQSANLFEIDARSAVSQCETAQRVVVEMQTRSELAEAQAAELREQLEMLQTVRTHEQTADLTQLQSSLTSAEEQLAQIKNELSTQTAVHQKVVADLAIRQVELATSQEQLSDAYRQLTELQAVVTRNDKERAQLAAELTASESRINNLTRELESANRRLVDELTGPQAQIVELTEQLEKLRHEKDSELAIRNRQLEELSIANEAIKHNTAAELSEQTHHVEMLTAELQHAREQLEECAAQGERLNELYQQARAELEAARKIEHTTSSYVEEESSTYLAEGVADETETTIIDSENDSSFTVDLPQPAIIRDKPTDSDFQSTSFIDRYSHLFDQDDPAADIDYRPIATTQESGPSALEDIQGDDSAALEAYMANMMKRVRGESSSDAIAPPVSHAAVEPGDDINPVERMVMLTQRVAAGPKPEPATENLIDLQELKETSQKPPLPTSLMAMRELANISARQAIAKHRKRRHFERALSKLLISLIAAGTAAAMIYTAEDYMSPYFLAGCAVGIVSAFWGSKLFAILLEMIRESINDERTPAEISEADDPLPIDGVAD